MENSNIGNSSLNSGYSVFEQAKAEYFKKQKTALWIYYITVGVFLVPFLLILSIFLSNIFFVGEGMFDYIAMLFFAIFVSAIIALVYSIFSSSNKSANLIINKEYNNYRSAYKNYFVRNCMKRYFTNLSYSQHTGIPKQLVYGTGMIKAGNRYHSEDCAQGKYKNVDFIQADVTIQNRTADSKGNQNVVTILRGQWMIFDFPKKFNFRLKVVDKHFGNADIKVDKDPITGRKMKRIQTESISFNKQFDIFADDDFEAFYLLDPSFIYNVEKLADSKQYKLMMCFIDNHLHICLFDNKDFFEPPYKEREFISEADENKKVCDQISTITDFVDFLKLDHKIFK